MGMGYGANYADVIDEKNLNNITGGLVGELEDLLNKGDSCLEEFAQDVEYEGGIIEDEELWKKADKLYHEIQEVFTKETGLELYLRFHDSDEQGDRYDGVNGAYWDVDGMYELSPAGKKLLEKANVERQYFVSYG